MAITAQLREAVTGEAFAGLWPDEVPPFDAFMEFLGGLLGRDLPADVANLRVELKRTDRWRIRVDGACDSAGGPLLFYAEVVWLPTGRMYRGTGAVRKAPEEPPPKAIVEFIEAIEAISEDRDLIVSSQAYEASRGFHPQPGELRRAFPAIFQVLELSISSTKSSGLQAQIPRQSHGCHWSARLLRIQPRTHGCVISPESF